MRIVYGYARALSFVMFMVLGGLAGQAGAVCAQTDGTGTWYAFAVAGNSARGGFDSYVRCKIVLNSLGTVLTTSACKGRDDVGVYYASVTGGLVKVWPGCAITGYLILGGARYTIEYGQMAQSKNIISFAIYQYANPDNLGVLTGVKQ